MATLVIEEEEREHAGRSEEGALHSHRPSLSSMVPGVSIAHGSRAS
jgi:hypothetical protein